MILIVRNLDAILLCAFVGFLVEINVTNDCQLGGGASEMVFKTSKTAFHGEVKCVICWLRTQLEGQSFQLR